MASPEGKIFLSPTSVFVSPCSSIILTASGIPTKNNGVIWKKSVQNSSHILITGSLKYGECACIGNPTVRRLIINNIADTDEGIYWVEVKEGTTLTSNFMSLYVLEDENGVCKEELNLMRYKDCESIAKDALKHKFDSCVSAKDLVQHLSRYRKDLQTVLHCTSPQLDILFPSNASSVSSENFDISLLYKLLRNTTNVQSPVKGWGDHVPPIESTGEGDDIERIRQYRNSISHKSLTQLSDKEFESRWIDLTMAIDRLSKGSLREAIYQLRLKAYREKGRTIKESFYLKRNTIEPKDQFVATWEVDDRLFCEEIRFAAQAYKIVKENNLIIIIGSSGCGKTATARHCALKLAKVGWNVLPVDEFKDIKSNRYKENCICVVDDPVGKWGLDEIRLSDIEHCNDEILQIINQGNHKLIITCRTILYNEAKSYHVFDNYNVVDIEDRSHALNISEKQKLLQTYDIESIVDLSSLNRANFMFPFMCYMLFKNKKNGIQSGNQKAVLDPCDYFLKHLDTMYKTEKVLYASLVLLMITNNNYRDASQKNWDLIIDIFKKCNIHDQPRSLGEIREQLEYSVNTYVIKTEFGFQFLHDSLFEVVAYHFGQDKENQNLLIRHINIDYLANNTYVGSREASIRDLHIKINPDNYKTLCHRFEFALKKIIRVTLDVSPVYPIFTHNCWSDDKFVNSFFETFGNKAVLELFSKSYNVQKFKPQTKAQRRASTLFQKQDFLEHHGERGIQEVCDDGTIRLIDWVVYNGHVTFLKHLLKSRKFVWFPFNKIIETGRLFWLSLYSLDKDMLRFAMSEINQKEIWKYIDKPFHSFHTPLTLACSFNALEIVQILIEEGANVQHCNAEKESPLSLAVKNGFNEIIKLLLEKYPFLDVKSELSLFENDGEIGNLDTFKTLLEYCNHAITTQSGKTPLHLAIDLGLNDVAENLIQNEANVNAADSRRETPLHVACSKNNVHIFRLLVTHGAQLHLSNSLNETPLQIAMKTKSLDILQTLLTDLHIQPFKALLEQSFTDMGYLAAKQCAEKIIKQTLEKSPPENFKQLLETCESEDAIFDGKSPLHVALDHGFYESAKMLIRRSFCINAKDTNKETPLHIACKINHIDIVKLLMKENASIFVFNCHNESPLTFAFRSGSLELLQYFLLTCPLSKFKLLLDKCYRLDTYCSDESPVSFPFKQGSVEMIQHLIKSCPIENFAFLKEKYDQPFSGTIDGKPPLHVAIENSFIDIAKSLISCDVNVNAIDDTNQTPLHIACTLKNTEAVYFVEYLIQHGANFNATDVRSQTPLHIAYQNENTEIAQALLVHLCDTSVEDSMRRLPFHIVCKKGNLQLVKLLYDSKYLELKDLFGKTPYFYAKQHQCIQNFFNRKGGIFS